MRKEKKVLKIGNFRISMLGLLSLFVILSMVLSACGSEGALSGAASGKGGKGNDDDKGGGSDNSNDNSGSDNNNAGGNSDDNNAGGNSDDNNAGGNSDDNNAGGNSDDNNAGGNSDDNNAGGNDDNNAGGNSDNGGSDNSNAGGNSDNGGSDNSENFNNSAKEKNTKVSLCHATGSETNPYVFITVSYNAATEGHGHESHSGDIIPASASDCPGGKNNDKPDPEKISLCHATGSETNPYVFITVSVNAANSNGSSDHQSHEGDIIPASSGDCPGGEKTPPEKISLCHATGSETNPYVFITVSVNAANSNGSSDHQSHAGDIIPATSADCGGPEEEKVVVCHIGVGGDELVIDKSALDAHLSHGDILRPADGCGGDEPGDVVVCHDGAALTIAEGDLGEHTGHGDDYPYNADTCGTTTDTPTPTPPTETPPPSEPEPNVPDDIDVAAAPEPNPDTCPQFIVFHTFRDGNLEIYRMDGVEGEGATYYNLSNSNAVDSRPSRSADDQWVAFESDRTGNVELFYTDIEGEAQVRLTYTGGGISNINPMFGPDNETVAFQSNRDGNWNIYTINILTGEERQITSDEHDDVRPFWSPDPRYLAFESNRTGSWDILLFDLETGEEYQVTRGVGSEIFPAWSPKGDQLAFLSDVNGTLDLFVSSINGNDPYQVSSGGDAGNHSWDPYGLKIAYQTQRGDDLDVFTFDLQTFTEYGVSTFTGPDSAPSWDCGGTSVSFTSTRDGNANLFEVFWQGGDESNLTWSPATDKWSQWSPSKETGSRGR